VVGPPRQIVLIRHAEKPSAGAVGIDVDGNASDRCLTPRGWQRAGALATFFAQAGTRAGPLARPDNLHSPEYETRNRTINHRTYETILPLSERLGVPIRSGHKEGHEEKLVRHILAEDAGTSLVCWEHTLLEAIASHLPLAAASPSPPASWPADRFDLIWLFSLAGGEAGPEYTFAELPQLLLAGDSAG
jgi:hypothetical protein